ncbi:MAG: PA2169 family four-helix-bundle protein [Gammaproteobacteria bacterium]|nr:PA2169 family four-helix-bundle protein [Gammaproteobacteria bacterium]
MTEIFDSKVVIKNLNDLIELDYDAIAAYQAAIDRLEDINYKDQLAIFMQDHENHIATLSQLVSQEGGAPADGTDMKVILTKGKVIIAELGGDEAILKAMLMNEEVTNKTYEKEVGKGYRPPIQAILMDHLADERRHKEWLEVALLE